MVKGTRGDDGSPVKVNWTVRVPAAASVMVKSQESRVYKCVLQDERSEDVKRRKEAERNSSYGKELECRIQGSLQASPFRTLSRNINYQKMYNTILYST